MVTCRIHVCLNVGQLNLLTRIVNVTRTYPCCHFGVDTWHPHDESILSWGPIFISLVVTYIYIYGNAINC